MRKYTIEELGALRETIARLRETLRGLIPAEPLAQDGSTRCTHCGGFTLHFEDCPADPLDDKSAHQARDQRERDADDGQQYGHPGDELRERAERRLSDD